MTIRFLRDADLELYRPLRLAAVRDCPTAFGSDYTRESELSPEQLKERFRTPDEPDNGIFGAFIESESSTILAGILGFSRERGVKRRHVATLWSAIVAPDYQRRGIGGKLLDAAISHGRAIGCRQITLTVTANNAGARRLYISRGFEPFGLQRGELFVDGDYYDLEYLALYLYRHAPVYESSSSEPGDFIPTCA